MPDPCFERVICRIKLASPSIWKLSGYACPESVEAARRGGYSPPYGCYAIVHGLMSCCPSVWAAGGRSLVARLSVGTFFGHSASHATGAPDVDLEMD